MAIVRFTRQRQAVLEAVQASREHPDAARVFESVRLVVPNISLGTVYRSLEALVTDGHLLQIQQPGAATRYDARLERHYHLLCASCGEVFDVELELPDLVSVARQALEASFRQGPHGQGPHGQGPHGQGFDVRAVTVEFHGVCARCQRN
jgi:Fur family transcriptional regulator, ferric uptake regulator